MTTTDRDWLTVNEAAKLSGYNPEYIRRLMRDGKIKYRKFSFMYQVNRESLLTYLENAESTFDKRFSPKRKKVV
jgi:excisionase family DNA binding protein